MIGTLVIALSKAFGQTDDPALRRVMWRGFGIAVLLFVTLMAASWWALSGLALIGIGWADATLTGLGMLAAAVIAVVLFPGAMIAAQSLLLDDVAEAVEDLHYPDDRTDAPPFMTSLVASLRLAGLTIGLNLLCLPLYFVPVVNLFVFFALNGYLLGREYFELVALRRMGQRAATAMRKRYRGGLFLAGIVAAGLFSIPVIGWFMPAPVAAMMVHVFHSLQRRDASRGFVPV